MQNINENQHSIFKAQWVNSELRKYLNINRSAKSVKMKFQLFILCCCVLQNIYGFDADEISKFVEIAQETEWKQLFNVGIFSSSKIVKFIHRIWRQRESLAVLMLPMAAFHTNAHCSCTKIIIVAVQFSPKNGF